MTEPTKDQTYCDLNMHQQCSGYTEDESDPETCMCSCHDSQLRAEHEAAADLPEVGKWNADIGGMVIKVTPNWIVCVTPMIFNDRVTLARHDEWRSGWTVGCCYDKGGAAALAAMAWDPETERYPVGYKKVAGDAR